MTNQQNDLLALEVIKLRQENERLQREVDTAFEEGYAEGACDMGTGLNDLQAVALAAREVLKHESGNRYQPWIVKLRKALEMMK